MMNRKGFQPGRYSGIGLWCNKSVRGKFSVNILLNAKKLKRFPWTSRMRAGVSIFIRFIKGVGLYRYIFYKEETTFSASRGSFMVSKMLSHPRSWHAGKGLREPTRVTPRPVWGFVVAVCLLSSAWSWTCSRQYGLITKCLVIIQKHKEVV